MEDLFEKQILEFNLSSGRTLRLDGFYFGFTYIELIEGTVDKDDNQRFFERLSYPKNRGDRQTLKIAPTETEFSSIS